jgi:hypothetical protein
MRFIVCLTTIPPRARTIYKSLFSWLIQSTPIEKIIISIPNQYQRFNQTINKKEIEGVSDKIKVQELDVDYGAGSKFYGALKYYHSLPIEERKDLNIIICDDDLIYDKEIVGTYLSNATNEKIIYTFFNVRNEIYDLPHLQGADTFCLPNHFLENTSDKDFQTFIEKSHRECFDTFFHDDYIISYFVYKICNYKIKTIRSNKIFGMVYREADQILELHRDTLVEHRRKNVINYIKNILSKEYKYISIKV